MTVCVILLNAVVLGLQTYSGLVASYGDLLTALDVACYCYYVVELIIRIGAFGKRPWDFLRSGWNVFDLVIVLAVLIPGIRENVTLLRLLRLSRVLRVVRAFPTLRVIIVAVWRSIPGAIGLFAVAGVVLYLYGMVGWIMFGEKLPEQFGSIGKALLTMFLLLSFDNLGEVVRAGVEVTPWALVYYVSFVLFCALVLVNILIGVVLGSMEEARAIEASENKTGEVDVHLDAIHRAVGALRTELADRKP